MTRLTIRIFAIILMAACLTIGQPSVFAQTAKPSFAFDVLKKEVKLNTPFSVDIIIDTAGQEIIGAGARIQFLPDLLQVTSIKKTTLFDDYPSVVYDNKAGRIYVSGIKNSADDQFSGTGTLATITFQAIHTGTDNLRFLFEPGKTDDSNLAVTSAKEDILENVSFATITITETGSGQTTISSLPTGPNGEVLGESGENVPGNDGTETVLTARGGEKQQAAQAEVRSEKSSPLGKLPFLDIPPVAQWDRSLLVALLAVNVAGMGAVGMYIFRRMR